MQNILGQFAEAEASGGIAALGLNWQSFLFQLITFVIVLLILRQFVFKKLVTTLEDRRLTVEKSIEHAAETEAKLKQAEEKIAKMLARARDQADEVVGASHKEAAGIVEAAESKAVKRAEHIVKEAKSQMDVEITKARAALKAETAQLVMVATERIIKEKLDAKKDAALIDDALKGAKERA
ncbi:MAG: F0F1 ATP synthase subunit B [Candidatus Saccharimonadales bacterium]